jgi:hypothetical protein
MSSDGPFIPGYDGSDASRLPGSVSRDVVNAHHRPVIV